MQKRLSFLDNVSPFGVWLILFTAILGFSLLTSFFPVWANVPVNVVLPVLVLIFLKTVFFEKLKLSTLLLLRTLIVLAVFLSAFAGIDGKWFVYLVLVFLAINILEATFTDLKHKCYFNFVTGLALTATILTLLKVQWIDVMGGEKLAFAYIYQAGNEAVIGTVCWFIAYTIWNWIFVTDEFSPSIALLHVGILAAPIVGVLLMMIPEFSKNSLLVPASLWLVFRANSLTVGGILQISYKDFIEKKLAVPGFARFVAASKKKPVQAILMVINLALLAVPAYYSISALLK